MKSQPVVRWWFWQLLKLNELGNARGNEHLEQEWNTRRNTRKPPRSQEVPETRSSLTSAITVCYLRPRERGVCLGVSCRCLSLIVAACDVVTYATTIIVDCVTIPHCTLQCTFKNLPTYDTIDFDHRMVLVRVPLTTDLPCGARGVLTGSQRVPAPEVLEAL